MKITDSYSPTSLLHNATIFCVANLTAQHNRLAIEGSCTWDCFESQALEWTKTGNDVMSLLSMQLYCQRDTWVSTFDHPHVWINKILDIHCNFPFYLCLVEVSDYLQHCTFFPQLSFFPSFLSTVLSCTCAYTQIFLSCLFTRPSTYFLPKSMSLYIPHPAVIHIVYSSLKTHPVSCKLLVPPPLPILSPSPFPLSSVSLLLRMFG